MASDTKSGLGIIGVGAAACAVCCAGPIVGFLAALGLGALIGIALFSVVGLVAVGAVAAVLVGRRRAAACPPLGAETVDLITRPTHR